MVNDVDSLSPELADALVQNKSSEPRRICCLFISYFHQVILNFKMKEIKKPTKRVQVKEKIAKFLKVIDSRNGILFDQIVKNENSKYYFILFY